MEELGLSSSDEESSSKAPVVVRKKRIIRLLDEDEISKPPAKKPTISTKDEQKKPPAAKTAKYAKIDSDAIGEGGAAAAGAIGGSEAGAKPMKEKKKKKAVRKKVSAKDTTALLPPPSASSTSDIVIQKKKNADGDGADKAKKAVAADVSSEVVPPSDSKTSSIKKKPPPSATETGARAQPPSTFLPSTLANGSLSGPSSFADDGKGTAAVKPKRPTMSSGSSIIRSTAPIGGGEGGSSSADPMTGANREIIHRTRNSFEKELLEWDFLAAWEEEIAPSSSQADDPTAVATATSSGSSGSKTEEEKEARCAPVPDTFTSAKHYVEVWFPLLLQEMQAETLSDLQTEGLGGFTKVVLESQGAQPDKVENLKVQKFENIDGHGHVAGHERRKLRDCHQYDLVLLVRKMEPVVDALAKAKGAKKADRQPLPEAVGLLGLVNPYGHGHGFNIKVSSTRFTRFGAKEMYGCTIRSLISSIREVSALLNVAKMPLLTRLLNGDQGGGRAAGGNVNSLFAELGEGFVKRMLEKFNESQVTAIKAAATNVGFTLIKGPPGTGKTTTLKGLLNSIHLREYQRFYKSVLKIAQMEDGDTDQAWLKYREQKPHILVTAPSNVAVDNIVLRIMEDGFIDGNGRRYNPPIVRMGRLQSERVRAVSLDSQADQLMIEKDQMLAQRCMAGRMEIAQMKQGVALSRSRLRLLCKAVTKQLPFGWQARVDDTGLVVFFAPQTGESQSVFPIKPAGNMEEDGEILGGMTLEQLPEYNRYCQELTSLVEMIENKTLEVGQAEIRLQGMGPGSGRDRLRSELETNILDSAHLVFTTLNTAATPSVMGGAKFHVVVVDEAAQAIEPSTLIPLQTGASTCVLVGDPQQLPATVFSQLGPSTAFERSLFQRLEHGGHPVHLLDTQYRMHPLISAFPRKHFYGDMLKDGANVREPSYTRPWHRIPAFQPFTFLDLRSDTDKGSAGVASLRNSSEARLIVHMYVTMKRESGDEIKGRTGVITPYALQLQELHNQFHRALGPTYQDEVELNTVDGYQGKEKDVIMISCVRAGGTKGIGFLADVRRMNVGLTRGRFAVLVVGRQDTLAKNRHWRALLDHALQAHALIQVPSPNCNLLELKPWDGKSQSPARAPSPTNNQQGGGGGRGRHGRGRGGGGGGRGRKGLMPPRGGRGVLMPPRGGAALLRPPAPQQYPPAPIQHQQPVLPSHPGHSLPPGTSTSNNGWLIGNQPLLSPPASASYLPPSVPLPAQGGRGIPPGPQDPRL